MDWAQAEDECRLRHRPKTVARSSVASWTTAILRFLLPTLAVATPSIFLETDMRGAWAALLAEGRRREGGAWELVRAMLADCSTRDGGTWDTACDHALYLETVLKKVVAAAETPQICRDAFDENEERRDLQGNATDPIEVVPASNLSFSSFFLEFAVPRRPVILSGAAHQHGFEVEDSETSKARSEYNNNNSDLSSSEKDSSDDLVGSVAGAILERKQRQRLPLGAGDHFSVDSNVVACAPRSEDSIAGTVEGLLRDCPASVLASFEVPPHVAGDFTQRFRKRHVLPPQDLPAVEHFVSGWQTIHRTYRGSSTPATACPAGANALVSVMSGSLEVLVYTAEALPSLRPTYGDAPCPKRGNSTTSDIDYNGDSTTEDRATDDSRAARNGLVDVGDDERIDHLRHLDEAVISTEEESNKEGGDDRVIEEGLPSGHDSGKWPHEPRYCAKLWPGEGDRRNGSATAAPRQEGGRSAKARDVSAGDMLFVPSGGAVAWRAKGADEDEAVVARFCYVDASNFDAVKAQLPLYAAVEAGARSLLRAFRSPVFDASMNRKPSAVLASDFFSVNRQDTGTSTPSSLSSSSSMTEASDEYPGNSSDAINHEADGRQQQQQRRRLSGDRRKELDGLQSSSDSFYLSSSSSSSDSPGRESQQGGRKRRGRKSFKEWQDDARWDLKVLGLTLPTLEAPKATECGRTKCTIEWTSGFFVKQKQDQTKIGFNITFVPAMTWKNASLFYKEVYVGDERLKSEHSLERELLNLGITDGKRYTFVMDDANLLEPDTCYRFAVSFLYGETGGLFSELSKPARTAKITAPLPVTAAPEGSPEQAHSVTLRFHSPQDDGGSLVSWYHVMLRPTGGNVLSKWQAVGMAAAPAPRKDAQRDAVAVKVDNLVPGVAYQFRVCAQNEVGTSPWSAPSDPVIVKRAASQDGKQGSLDGFHAGRRHVRLPNVTQASVTYAGETQPPPGEGFDPFEWEVVHGPVVVLDDRAGKVRVNDSSLDIWTCHFSPKSFKVTAELVVAKPSDATRAVENGRFVRNRVALVERGSTPIVHKVLNAQRAGALGVVVADDGRCGLSFDQLCVYGSDPPDGWAALDLPRPWLEVRVPVVLMLEEDAARLTADARAAEQEAEALAWSSLYDGWMDSSGDAGWDQQDTP